jgi:C-5 cytosine-specific DNA methylase
MLIFDFFAGTKSSTQAFSDAGHKVITFELNKNFEDITEYVDIMNLTPEYLIQKYGKPDFIWASPPCTAFSVASIGHHWIQGGIQPLPRTKEAADNQVIVLHTRFLCEKLNPTYGFLIENPRGMLRKLPVVKGLEHRTVTYCKYGDTRMKPTDLWGSVKNWKARPHCKNGDKCHTPAPRGSFMGTQGMKNAKEKARVPYQLGQEILQAILGQVVNNVDNQLVLFND